MGAFDDLIPAASGGAFDDLIPVKPEQKSRTAIDVARDVGVTALKGAVGLPQAFVGLADIPTLGHAGKFLESVGYRPGEAQKILDEQFSEQTQADKKYVSQADGFFDTLGRAIERPSTIATSVGESLPQMLGGAGIARGLLKVAPKAAPWLAGAIGEGVLGAGGAAEQIRGETADGLLTPEQAAAAVGSGVGTAVLGAAGGKLAQRMGVADVDTMLAKGAGKLSQSPSGFVKQVLGAGISEGVFEELPQSVQEQMWQNYATGKPIGEGVGNAGAMGLLAGAAMGGAGGGYNALVSKVAPTPDQPAPAAPVPAAPTPAAPAAPDTPEVSAAEKALTTPVELTSLDRVNAIATELEGLQARQQEIAPGGAYGPMFDQERSDVAAKIAELSQERAELSKDWPAAVQGKASSFTTEAGARVDATYALMDAADLVTSHDTSLKTNPNYPQELQPRARDRAASEMQVSGIVQKLDPARLGLSADAANGAPIVGADGLVESGNARTIALKRVYQANGQKAADYKQFLKDNAEQFGITPESVDSMQKPVLVRLRTTPVNRAEFARQANASTVAMMSPTEQAKSDANRIDSMEDLKADDNGDFANASSQPFIRRFMARLPATEQAGMIDASGNLSTSGYARVRNAVLAKAYGDSPVLARMTESMDDNLRNVSKALLLAAPKVAQMREAVGAGNRFDADITPDLMGAVEELSRLKEKGTSVEDALAQAGMFGDDQPQEVRDLLQFLSENLRRPRKIADFITAYMDALDAAGDPNQGSLLGETTAPTKRDLLTAAERSQQDAIDTSAAKNAQRSEPGKDAQDGAAPQGQRENAQVNQGGAGRDGTAQESDTRLSRKRDSAEVEQSEWVNFPKDTGTIGIPRADMPQIKGEHRGALIQFLQARGIEHKTEEVPASGLKPTQAEFSTKKAARWSEVRDGVDRSVLVSNDGHILDGHHQWVAALAANEPVKAIVLDAPIRELMANVFQFPSVKQSDGSTSAENERAKPREDFKQAMAELVDIMADALGTRVMIMPSGNPKLHAVLVKLFDSAIRVVGTDLKAATKWVKEKLKGNPETKAYWNKITDKDFAAAAMAALEQQAKSHVDDLFAAAEKSQADLFANEPEAPKVAMIDGRAYEMERDNFQPEVAATVLPKEAVDAADAVIAKYPVDAEVPFSAEDVARAQGLLEPVLKKAAEAKVEYDQKIIDIAKRVGALGQQLAPLKGLKRGSEKLVEEGFDVSAMKDLLRSTIVVASYADAQAVMDEIEREFKLLRAPKNRTGDMPLRAQGKDVSPEDPVKYGGYSDIMVNVVMPNGTIAEIQINVPGMLSAKAGAGHAIYDRLRSSVKGSDRFNELLAASVEFYNVAREAFKKSASVMADQRDGQNLAGVSPNQGDFSSKKKIDPSGNLTYDRSTPSPSVKSIPNTQPSGKTSGTLISTSNTDNVAGKTENGYSQGNLFGERDGNDTDSGTGAKGKGTEAVSTANGKRGAPGARAGSGRTDQRGDGTLGAGGSTQESLGQAGTDGTGGKTENVGRTQSRARDGGPAGVPAGRDIPAKSGLNYEFGPDDLTYEGSWVKKATQNVEAVELLVKLEAEGRQATKDEQTILAKFVGWGSSEVANAVFGTAGDKNESKINAYRMAKEAIENTTSISPYHSSYWSILSVLNQVGKARVPYRSDIDSAFISPKNFGLESSDIKYGDLRARLKAVMSEAEWAEASRSTQYAHYTSKAIVTSMWKAMERMGFKGGAVMEPGAGIGVFPGLMPAAMAGNSAYTGIEFDSITGRILKQLFPDERILVESFVDSKLPKNFYDVAVGNPPFSGTLILGDPEYAKHSFTLHDYFFAKSIDRVKPGGLVVYVTSKGTMDKLGDKARQYLAYKADLVGAIRLPQTAFKQNAGTEVVTDVIFLRKKVDGQTFEHAKAWLKTATVKTPDGPAIINEYFAAHPEMVLGTHALQGSMYKANEYTVLPLPGDIEEHFANAVAKLPANIYSAQRGTSAEAAKVREIDFNPKAQKEGNYYVTDAGVLMVREGGVGIRAEDVAQKDMELVKDFVPLRDALKQAHYDQLNNGEWEKSMAALQKAYSAFTKKHGQINQFTTKMVKTTVVDEETGEKFSDEEARRTHTLLAKLKNDPDYTLVMALENINDDTGVITPSAFLTERVLGKQATPEVSTPTDAMLSVLNDIGHVDMQAIAQRLNISEQDAIEALGSAVYKDPEAGWQTYEEYLSGNVKRKLEVARAAAKADKSYERNVTALEAKQPEPKTPSQINASLGMNWIPGEVYSDFLREVTGVRASVEWNARTKQWIVQEKAGGSTMQARADWGTDRRNATDLLEAALTGRKIRIESRAGKNEAPKFDAAATEAANQKLASLQNEFQQWVWKDSDRTSLLVREFNDKFNTTVPRSFEGTHLTLPGTSKRWSVFNHVKRGAWRIIARGNTYLAHAVGSGKTFQMVISAMEQKRLGLIKKPMMVVPNHMLQQFAREWQDLYPAARLMVADENNFHTDNRRRFVSRVALSDLDGVIITQSAFKLLDLDPEFKQKMIKEQLDYMRAALIEAGGDPDTPGKNGKEPRIKQIEKQIENMEQKLEAAMSSVGKDKNARFDELGVDFLYVDEAHNYRKLDFTTNREVKGITPAGSAQAFDLYMKSRYLEEKKPGRSLVMASGTPVTNTVAELYTVQKFMDRQALIDKGIEDFDSWAAMFGREKTALEPNAAGKYEPVTRFSKFVNVPELTQMFREFADVLNSDHLAKLLGDKRPKVEGGSRKITITPKTDDYAAYQDVLTERVEESKKWKPSPDQPNNPDPIIKIIGDGRLAAIDMRFIDPSLPSDPDSKLNRMIDDVIQSYKDTSGMEYTDKAGNPEPNKGASMMVFSDLGFGAGVAASRGFNARAWFEKRMRDAGVPMAQVAFMSDYKKSADKLKLFKDVNAGRVRILVGSSKNMGTGVNAQQRLKALFHLDSPWYPADLEQREGRIIRQGNKNPLVQIFAYAAKGTYDENMWKMLASKQYFIDQALSGDPNLREIEDLDSMSQYDLAAAMIADDPRLLQLAGARADIEKMQRLYQAHEQQRMKFMEQSRNAQATIGFAEQQLTKATADAAKVQDLAGDKFTAKAGKKSYTVRTEWAQALIDQYKDLAAKVTTQTQSVGEISGFKVAFTGQDVAGQYVAKLVLETPEQIDLVLDAGTNLVGMTMRATNALSAIANLPAKLRERIVEARAQVDALATRLQTPFPMAQMLADKVKEASDLEAQIAADSKAKEEAAPTGEIEETKLSRGAGGGMDAKVLTALAAKIKAKMPNMPAVHVLADPSKAPKALRDYIEKQGATNDVEGAFHDGELYLFASGISDPIRAEHVLAEHEAAHYGLRAILGDSLNSSMQMIYNNSTYIRQLANELRKNGNLSISEATEEAIVDIPTSRLVKLQGWRKLVVKVRNWFAGHGFDGIASKLTVWLDGTLNDQQRADLMVANLVSTARLYVAAKHTGTFKINKGTMLATTLAEDFVEQEKWLMTEARARGYKDIDELAEKDYPLFEKLAKLWREKNPADNGVLLSRSGTAAQRADKIIQTVAATSKPIDALARTLTRVTGIERMTGAIYNRAAYLLDRFTPENVKAGLVSDYGVPEAVIDQRAMMQGRQRVQLRQAGALVEKLSTLTRAESRVAYAWMNEAEGEQADYFMNQLPPESVKVLEEVRQMIDKLSKDAVRLGQLGADVYEKNKFAYLRRSYAKYTLEQTPGEKASRARAISVLGEQYRGRGLTEAATMKQIQNAAPEWWQRKMVKGKADTSLKGEKLIRLERRAPAGEGINSLPGVEGNKQLGKILEVHYFPASENLPAKYADWTKADTFEVRDVQGDKAILWRDFTKDEREKMGEIDEARFAIAKTLQGMIHDVEVGRYLEWLATTQAKKEGETIPGEVVDASEKYRDTFKPGEWVRVPDSKLPGTNVLKYGKLAGRYLPGPVWNDLRQSINGQFRPFGETYGKILSAWKTAKTALSPAVHTNNIMSNFVMADWHDVTAGHTAKALRILLGAHDLGGKGALGSAGNKIAGAIGSADREAALEIVNRYKDSGGDIGSWATNEISKKQIEPLLEALEKELAATNGQSVQAQVGVYHALQHALQMRFPTAWESLKGSKVGKAVGTEASTMIDMYQSEDEVFRLAAWLKAKEEGKTDMEAGKIARRSFMDYSINAPWVQALRNSALPFVSYTYRAVPMFLETAAKKPHKLLKLMAIAGALNAFGMMMAGGGDDDRERKLLPEEKAGRIWGLVPKLLRMPWNDANGSPVYLDIRRFIPVGDVFDIGQGHSAIPMLPAMTPGGPLAILAEIVLNKQQFTGKAITLDTDTGVQKATKVLDYLYKAFMPNLLGVPGTYATTGVADAAGGKTDAFGRQQSVAQAMASSFGVKLGSYPADVLARNLQGQAQAKIMEIDKNIANLKRQRQMNGISVSEFESKVQTEQAKKVNVMTELAEKLK